MTNGGKCSGILPLLANNDVISNPSEKAIIFITQFPKKASIEGPDDPVPNDPIRENTTDLNELHTNYLEIGPKDEPKEEFMEDIEKKKEEMISYLNKTDDSFKAKKEKHLKL